jgi:hypothetical protein
LTLAALGALVTAISNGLLGHPDMNIAGNGSRTALLRWYQDVTGPVFPEAWVISLPMPAYRMAMLAWALWISFWLVKTLKWGWKRFSTPCIWKQDPGSGTHARKGWFRGFTGPGKRTDPDAGTGKGDPA